jgi:23S rRNA (guanosine2251-2'-O)-methyltransferase
MKNKNKIKVDNLNLVIGKNPVKELLKFDSSRIIAIYDCGNSGVEIPPEIAVRVVTRDKLTELAGTTSHQGIAAQVTVRPVVNFAEWSKSQREVSSSLVLILDDLSDPQNLGAIFRAAECFGVSALITSRNRRPPLSSTVTKASAGASELVNHIDVGNVVDAIERLKANDFWIVGATAVGSENITKFKFSPKTAIVMGSEGHGLKRLVQEKCDFLVGIPLFGKISSLNISQATSIMLHSWRASNS